jgi:germination protein M
MRKRIMAVIFAILFMLGLAGCSVTDVTSGSESTKTATIKYYLYYINKEGDQLVTERYHPESLEPSDMIRNFREQCSEPDSSDKNLQPLLSDGIQIKSTVVRDGVLYLNMNDQYSSLDTARELLVRAGLVKTFAQCDGISYVEITVNGAKLKDSYGNTIGKMSVDNFVENAGQSIHSYQSAEMTLYYTNEAGNALIPEKRTVYYSSNEPLERAVIEELIDGTTVDGHYAAVSSDTKILSVAIQDGVCYVNLDGSFQSTLINVQEDVQVYSIVNSLVATCGVTKVQFSVNGKSDGVFRKDMKLNKQYEKNEELIQN